MTKQGKMAMTAAKERLQWQIKRIPLDVKCRATIEAKRPFERENIK